MKIFKNADGEMDVDINIEDLLTEKGRLILTKTDGEKVVFDTENIDVNLLEKFQDDGEIESVEFENKEAKANGIDDLDLKSGSCCIVSGFCCKGGTSFND